MKKVFLISGLGFITILVTLVSMANLNVINLLVTNSDYGGGSSEMFNSNPEEEKLFYKDDGTTSDETLESLQSGLSGGGEGALNLLWLLQNAKEPNKESYAYQLLQVYAKLHEGEYNDLPYHTSPEAIAGSHKNETGLSSFVVPSVTGYGKANSGILGKTINGKKITLENAVKADIIGNAPRTGSVWVDKSNSGGDGHPDGPFQIINGKQPDSLANKNRTDKKYDLYNFVDTANHVDSTYNAIATRFAESGSTPDPRALGMLSALTHNRGAAGVGWSLFGLPYDLSSAGVKSASRHLKHSTVASMTPEELQVAAQFPKDLTKWFDAANIPLEEIAGNNSKGQATGTLLTLANGGFLDIPLQRVSASNMKSLSNTVIGKIFPGQTKNTIVDHVNKNFVKKPWDVLGISKSKYDSTYGSGLHANYEAAYSTKEGYFRNTVFYIDKNVTSGNYKAGPNTIVVRAIEGISMGYLLDAGVTGTYTVLKIAMEAGIKSLTDGTMIDPSNPSTFYKTAQDGKSDVFNPAGAASGNFGKFLDGLGLTGTLSVTQQAQIEAMYNVSGGPYSQAKRGQQTSKGFFYLDCSSFASIGLHMGMGKQIWNPNPQTSVIKGGAWLRSTNKTEPINGVTYDAKVVQLDKSGKPMAPSSKLDLSQGRTDKAWLDYLQAGDIVNGVRPAGDGHIFTYLGKNKTKEMMVLTQDISKVNANASKFKPGDHFTIQAYYTANKTYAGGTGGEYSGKMGVTKLWADSKAPNYQAMRPVYNLK